ncbi:hypothetical protein Pmar_PMAR003136 [Perkinsus marinus ATCC 50983]|uniref:Uncharacterized protein n=1 Tax=Perkinsus marinus (strain ATCC 50983 / TXsc) TaxID=423536 RepID=C5L301_PERM5|nr:hypothetical protein Pmar_PMAR003136 [Perkinsus marinus ATCC 50983]EER08888.1 hypothetical protein Pmar_PMAR003136 [Perkinsus marinus ATCC 50983]|eukprot:XP_002777072.1 hypothetical protein Pmar_PMAR003136 [Perkinsus marinus ATCC 50983]
MCDTCPFFYGSVHILVVHWSCYIPAKFFYRRRFQSFIEESVSYSERCLYFDGAGCLKIVIIVSILADGCESFLNETDYCCRHKFIVSIVNVYAVPALLLPVFPVTLFHVLYIDD